jgi:hypothetical protein
MGIFKKTEKKWQRDGSYSPAGHNSRTWQNIYKKKTWISPHTHNIMNTNNTPTQKNIRIRAWKHGTIPIKFQLPYIYSTSLYMQAPRNTSDSMHLSNKKIKRRVNLTSTKQLYMNFVRLLYNSLIQCYFILIFFECDNIYFKVKN